MTVTQPLENAPEQPSGSTQPARPTWYAKEAAQVVQELGGDATNGLTDPEAGNRLIAYGPNELHSEPPPSTWQVALVQLKDPMNLMLIAVTFVSFAIAQWSTGLVVAFLVALNVVLGTRQELAARASVDALAKMQIPQTKVVRSGTLKLIDSTGVVPGDIVQVEAGDLVPADGRILHTATLECQEAALTGESAPVGKDSHVLLGTDVAIGDSSNMLFQNTSVTRGTGTMIVTATGMSTEMGRIAGMLEAVGRVKSPLQKELDSLTRVIGVIAWVAVAVIVGMGLVRGMAFEDVMLLGVAMAISAIPTGLPTFVQAMLSYGAKLLAEAKAVVKNLTDVETLGATSAINTDKTGTLTMNEMMASQLYYLGHWYKISGSGYDKSGEILHAAGEDEPDFTRLAYLLTLCSDATVSDAGEVVGDPTEAALVVLAAKVGVDAEESRRKYPRVAEVPFDSEYKFMATFHSVTEPSGEQVNLGLVKGGPDVVMARCSHAVAADGSHVPLADMIGEINQANARMGERGLRVLAFAVRRVEDADLAGTRDDPMSMVEDLLFVGLVGIIDPLRPSSKDAVRVAQQAGIEVRMITGDHAVTAEAIGQDLGLGPGAVSGSDFRRLSDREVLDRLPDIHVFGRVAPEDKLRLVDLMQSQGRIVAMTGDAVNDAAALKKADIGVAMGSGSEVTKQAGKMILTDDNFGTLVHAVELGRGIYDKIVSYIRYQMSQLISLVLIFLAASVFNINSGVAMTPFMVLFLNFFVAVFPVIAIIKDPINPDIMSRPPRDPKVTITNGHAVARWLLYGAVLFLGGLIPLVWGPDDPSPDAPSASMTMTFAVIGLGTVFSGLVMRREPGSGLTPPILDAVKWLAIPLVLIVLGTELDFMQRALTAQSLTGPQWLAVIGLALATPVVVELDKALLRMRRGTMEPIRGEEAVAPSRARATVGASG